MDLKLRGKRALITGSTAGIGFAIARGLARERAEVIINGRSEQKVADAVRRITSEIERHRHRHRSLERGRGQSPAGARRPRRYPHQQCRHLRACSLPRDFGSGLVPLLRAERDERGEACSRADPADAPAELGPHHLHLERIRRADSGRDGALRAHQDGPARALARHRRERRRLGCDGERGAAGSDTLRWVVDFLAKVAAEHKAEQAEVEAEFLRTMRPSSIIRRFAEPDEVANLVVFLAGEGSSAITGAALRVDGGVVRSVI